MHQHLVIFILTHQLSNQNKNQSQIIQPIQQTIC